MKNSTLKLTSVILIILFALSIMPTIVRAADEAEGIMLQKENESIVYVKGLEATEYKYAFSQNEDSSAPTYATAAKDSNGEYVAVMDNNETYNYMFIDQEGTVTTLDLTKFKSITEEEIKDVEKLTKIIGITSDETTSNVSKEDDTTITTTRGKIVIKDEGTYQYEMLEILDKNGSTKNINQTAKELYDQLSELQKATKMYDKLLAEITIRDDFAKLVEDASWKDAKNKEILQPEDSQEGEKFVVLIQEVRDGNVVRRDVQFMTCDRADAEGVEVTEKEETKTVEKKVKLPVTGENLALYITLAVVVLAIIIVAIRMKVASKEPKGKRFK